MYLILTISIIFFYFVMQSIELASFASRLAGRISSNLALGTTVHNTMYVGSRFFLVPFLPILAYLVETGLDLNNYLIIVTISLGSVLLMSILVLFSINFLQIFFEIVFKKNIDNYLPTALFKALFSMHKIRESFTTCKTFSFELINMKKVIVSFLAYSFLVTGFFVAFSLAIIFPDYQLTLSQSTSIFHGFGAIIVAFYLDPMLSRSMDRLNNNEDWISNAYSILFGRVLSYFVACFSFIVFYLLV